jgi:hypothetical protein
MSARSRGTHPFKKIPPGRDEHLLLAENELASGDLPEGSEKSEREPGWFPNLQVKIRLKFLLESSEENHGSAFSS